MILAVSASVLNEFINKRGTSESYLRLRCSICLTDKSKNVLPSLTSMTDLGPTQPIDVPNPPFNLSTANLLKLSAVSDLRESYSTTSLSLGDLILSQSRVVPDALSVKYRLNKAKNESISFSNLAWASGSLTVSTNAFKAFRICDAETFVAVLSNACVSSSKRLAN
ncbi:hypothetical protein PGUG_04267 [Meyerozyma guilliermondii ATCC 6260]|uniref:Uncharacterized protein n=1 Tax=Meyerozyma guilliermondii (strain ATCC 6260 / CBS 566 / DSM 6381 / JCM 1539 / NBRC 10279 / NRRL Y-324) TaxID=294746 RepID=A5DLW6_PICGU|nr:uncharacterized protein PGUG_04267 [Meyerozyma guilliermondii ATCC 6260]EDK40168.1 hypothetical protein PGUG_04267 [Meyerozyma guilliermondii ATCC 6260]